LIYESFLPSFLKEKKKITLITLIFMIATFGHSQTIYSKLKNAESRAQISNEQAVFNESGAYNGDCYGTQSNNLNNQDTADFLICGAF